MSLSPRGWTIRVRLTVLYGGLFFLAGIVLLALTYVLVKQSLGARTTPNLDPAVLDRLRALFTSRFDPATLANLASEIERQQQQYQQQTLDALLTQGAIALGVVGIVAIGLGWVTADRVVRPLHRITETAGRIAASAPGVGLHERIGLHGPRDEITRLAETFDLMLERLDGAFDGQRTFVANASHELRTPLTINRALIELTLSRPDVPGSTRELGESLLTINDRHERLIDGLLTLADSENALRERSGLDLADVAAHVVRATPADDLAVSVDLLAAPTTGDPVLLERVVQNLVDNAVRHNGPGGTVQVVTGVREGMAELVVSNTGAVVPPYEVETIFKPFRRLGGDRTGTARGFGLGLAIVAAVTRAHGGTVRAVPRDGGGLTVTVRLPKA
jgi:signal transduction histidine kinase